MKNFALTLVTLLAFTSAAIVLAQSEDDAVAPVTVAAETAVTPANNANGVTLWLHPTTPEQSAVIGTDEDGGIVVYDLDGEQLQYLPDGEITNLDLRYNFPLNDDEMVTLLTAVSQSDNTLLAYTIDADTRELTQVASIETNIPVTGLCMYHSPLSGKFYAIVNSEEGDVQQWEITSDDGTVSGEILREFSVGSETEGCVADDELGHLYIAEEELAIWKYGAEPENGSSRSILDMVGGHIPEQVEGLTLYYGADGTGYLIGASDSDSTYLVYRREGDNEYVGRFSVVAGEGIDGADESNGIDVTNMPLGEAYPEGLFVASDDSNTDPDDDTNFKLVSWGDIAAALELMADTGHDPRMIGMGADATASAATFNPNTNVVSVFASAETQPVPNRTDAADDPAI
ncbi:MAG: phytase, partial [Burkholderiales bacterium]|nr:phytase [Anaerolineae bacterium]